MLNETMDGMPIYMHSQVITDLPNSEDKQYNVDIPPNIKYAWIDMSNTYIYSIGVYPNDGYRCYPAVYSSPSNFADSISLLLERTGHLLTVRTRSNWEGTYNIYLVIKYYLTN